MGTSQKARGCHLGPSLFQSRGLPTALRGNAKPRAGNAHPHPPPSREVKEELESDPRRRWIVNFAQRWRRILAAPSALHQIHALSLSRSHLSNAGWERTSFPRRSLSVFSRTEFGSERHSREGVCRFSLEQSLESTSFPRRRETRLSRATPRGECGVSSVRRARNRVIFGRQSIGVARRPGFPPSRE
jgi:hypothetical protein